LPIPLYRQLERALREAIESGQWQSGQQLPNEGELAQTFGVSKITVRQALQLLAHQGFVRREQGRGTFVSTARFGEGPRELTSFSEEMRSHNLTATSRVLEQIAAKATDRVAQALGIRAGDAVLRLKRLRMANAEPMAIQTAHIPLALAPGVVGESFENSSLYDLLQSKYGLQPLRARETYHAVAAEAAVAELLGVPSGSPVFAVERITFLPSGKALEFVQSIMRGDRYSIILELAANRTPQAVREAGPQ
jgi:GntR family transcriptional regulator